MTYAGLHRFNLADGKLVWKTLYDVTDGTMKNTNGQALFDGDVIYTSSQGVLRAIDKNTGSVKRATKDFGKGGIAEMQTYNGVLYGRMGGRFELETWQIVKKARSAWWPLTRTAAARIGYIPEPRIPLQR